MWNFMQLSLNYMSTSVIVVMLQVWRAQSYLCVVWEFLLFSLRVIVMLQVWHAQWRTFVSSGSCWCLVCMLSLWCCRCDMPSRTSASTGCVDWEFLMFSLHVIVVMLQVWRAHWLTFTSSGSCWCLACVLMMTAENVNASTARRPGRATVSEFAADWFLTSTDTEMSAMNEWHC